MKVDGRMLGTLQAHTARRPNWCGQCVCAWACQRVQLIHEYLIRSHYCHLRASVRGFFGRSAEHRIHQFVTKQRMRWWFQLALLSRAQLNLTCQPAASYINTKYSQLGLLCGWAKHDIASWYYWGGWWLNEDSVSVYLNLKALWRMLELQWFCVHASWNRWRMTIFSASLHTSIRVVCLPHTWVPPFVGLASLSNSSRAFACAAAQSGVQSIRKQLFTDLGSFAQHFRLKLQTGKY